MSVVNDLFASLCVISYSHKNIYKSCSCIYSWRREHPISTTEELFIGSHQYYIPPKNAGPQYSELKESQLSHTKYHVPKGNTFDRIHHHCSSHRHSISHRLFWLWSVDSSFVISQEKSSVLWCHGHGSCSFSSCFVFQKHKNEWHKQPCGICSTDGRFFISYNKHLTNSSKGHACFLTFSCYSCIT